MLPPFSALVAVEKACPKAGATPKQPIIGSSGRTRCSRPGTAGSGVTVSPCRSMRQFVLSRGGRPRTNSGSTTLPASDARVQPVARIGVMRRISTLSASPGSAPVTEIGPFIGLGSDARCAPSLSMPWASMVSVITVSPEATVRAGGSVPSTLCQVVAMNRCVVMVEGVARLLNGSKNGSSRGRCRSWMPAMVSRSGRLGPCRHSRQVFASVLVVPDRRRRGRCRRRNRCGGCCGRRSARRTRHDKFGTAGC